MTPRLTLTSTFQEAEAFLPTAKEFLMDAFHLGGCGKCSYKASETLEEVATRYGKNPEALVDALEQERALLEGLEISPAELGSLLESKTPLLLLDVRQEWEFAVCHLPGSVRVHEENWEAAMQQAKGGTLTVCVCHHGVRSLGAARNLQREGAGNVRSLSGGLDAYSLLVDPQLPRY